MTFLPATVSVSYCPPGTSQVEAAISASSANSSTKVLGRRSFIAVEQRAEGATVPAGPPPAAVPACRRRTAANPCRLAASQATRTDPIQRGSKGLSQRSSAQRNKATMPSVIPR